MRLILALVVVWLALPVAAQDVVPEREGNAAPEASPLLGDPAVAAAARLRDAVKSIDPAAEFMANGALFTVQGLRLTLVFDLRADRMRVVAPVGPAADVSGPELIRLMQANFDSALDARYAIAKDILWSVFIHPLSTLETEEFASGIGQTVNLVTSYGASYSSGALIFGGGDSAEAQRKLIEDLRDKTREI